MRWRLVDRVTGLEPWKAIEGTKTVSLEEYSLYERLGYPGILPATVVLESCSQLACWLVWASSGGRSASVIDDVSDFEMTPHHAMGAVLHLRVSVLSRHEDGVSVQCTVKSGERHVGSGVLDLRFLSACEAYPPGTASEMWEEINATA